MKRFRMITLLLLVVTLFIQSCGLMPEPQASYTPPEPYTPSPSLSPTVSNTPAPDDLSFMPEYPDEPEASQTQDLSGTQDDTDTQGDTGQAGITRTYTFRTPQLRLSHFTKHGIDMGFTTEEAYEQAAARVVTNPRALHKTEAEDGDDVYYVEDTNEFVVLSTDGYIRTYFCPDNGKKYFDKQ